MKLRSHQANVFVRIYWRGHWAGSSNFSTYRRKPNRRHGDQPINLVPSAGSTHPSFRLLVQQRRAGGCNE